MFWLTEVSVDPPDQKEYVSVASGVPTALSASSEGFLLLPAARVDIFSFSNRKQQPMMQIHLLKKN